MATLSRPILPSLPSASPPAVTPFPMNILSHLRLATGYARFTTSAASAGNHLSKVSVCSAARVRVSSTTDTLLNESWLASLSCPFTKKEELDLCLHSNSDSDSGEVIGGSGSAAPEWIIGVDPDASGALAILRPDQSPSGYSAEVFDAPFVKVMVGKTLRKRLDPRSIVQLLHSFNAPIGTKAYIEQSAPFPQDGKQDDSRRIASEMFPPLASVLKRKKDHGRAEALLIAAYGRSLTQKSVLNSTLIESKESKELQLQLC